MASNRLSFVIALKFLTENFSRQATRVKSQLYTLQRHFLALASAAGVGAIGLNNFLSKMIETAKKTSQASIALQNVSGNMKAYAENQQWLLGIAKKYGVEINSLTTGFAKFKAAADISNMSMEDQRKIFESVSRATVAFGLSQEDQRGVFMALSQMMSKNKVMAEELRLQLAERMPVAIQAMAKAAGVTVNELDALMKQGKVLSSEVLPKFADALTEMTPNVNLDNLNKSRTDLLNTFNTLTKKLGVEQAYKSMVDGANKALRWLVDNVESTVNLIIEAFGALTLTKIGGSLFKDYQKSVDVAMQAIERKRVAEETAAESAKQAEEAKTAFEKAQAAERTAIAKLENAQDIREVYIAQEEITAARKKTASAERAMIKANKQAFQDAERAKRQAANVTAETVNMASAASATGLTKLGNILKGTLATAISKVGLALKAAFSATIWTAILTATMEIAQRLWDAVKGARELRRQIKETESRIESVAGEDLTRLNVVKENFNISKSYEVRKAALKEINGILGTEYDITNLTKSAYDDINKSLRRRIELLVKGKQLENAIQERAAAEATINRLGQKSTTEKVRRFGPFAWNTGGLSEKEKRELDAARAVLGKTNAWIEANYGDIEDVAVFGGATPKNSGAGTAKIPVISLTIDEDDVAATMEQLQDAIFANDAEAKRKQAFAMQHRGQSILNSTRDTSGDWKLSPTEILEADKLFAQEKVAKLIAFAEETGNDMGVAIQEGIAKVGTLEEAIRGAELADALKTAQAELKNAKIDLFEGAVDNIDGVVNAISRLNDALNEDSSAWEILAASIEVYKSLMSGVIETIQSVAAIKEATASAEKLQSQQNTTAAMGEAMAKGTASAAKLPWPVNLAAIASVVASILSVFSMIPKFAKGGVVGGNSTQGDKVLARLNSGEGVLTAVGMQSLHDASNPANSRNIRVTGVLVGEGRTLKAIIDKEVKYLTLTK